MAASMPRPRSQRHRSATGAIGRAAAATSGPFRDAVVRSLITLKALTSRADRRHRRRADHVAAGRARRRAQLGLSLLLAARLHAHAGRADARRLPRGSRRPGATGSCAPSPARPAQLQIMYGVAGEHRLTELELPWLPGYEESRPVRIGNGAYDQFQLDVYGEVIDALYDARVKGLPGDAGSWDMLRCWSTSWSRIGSEPDEGIWEVRGETSSTSPTRSSWRGWRSIARFDCSRSSASAAAQGRAADGPLARAARADPRATFFARVQPARGPSPSPTARTRSTPACS